MWARLSGAVYLVFAALLFLSFFFYPPLFRKDNAIAANATITVNAAATLGTWNTQYSTQQIYPGWWDDIPAAVPRLNSLAPPLMRIHAGTDGGSGAEALPETYTEGVWTGTGNTFTNLDAMVQKVRDYGGEPVMNVRYPPNWMWTCPTKFAGQAGYLADTTYTKLANYMARLVNYYNKGSMQTESGSTITNPRGTANRITYWEIMNEPDYNGETPCAPSSGVAFTPTQYYQMWNVVAPAMKAVDPTIKLVGPVPANAYTGWNPDYVEAFIDNATTQPDVISYHGYGDWQGNASDKAVWIGNANTGGLKAIFDDGLLLVRGWMAGSAVQGRPVWVTETNVQAAGSDVSNRPRKAFGAAWLSSAFRHGGLGPSGSGSDGVAMIYQYQFQESPNFGLVQEYGASSPGTPYLPYWALYYLKQYFTPGSTILSASTTIADVEVLAVRPPSSSNINVLVINRQYPSTGSGGLGIAATVTVTINNAGTISSATLRQIDDTTSALNGPSLQNLSLNIVPSSPFDVFAANPTQVINCAGYCVAFLQFTPSSGGAGGTGEGSGGTSGGTGGAGGDSGTTVTGLPGSGETVAISSGIDLPGIGSEIGQLAKDLSLGKVTSINSVNAWLLLIMVMGAISGFLLSIWIMINYRNLDLGAFAGDIRSKIPKFGQKLDPPEPITPPSQT